MQNISEPSANRDVTLERSLDRLNSIESELRSQVDFLGQVAARLFGGIPTSPPLPEGNQPKPTGLMDRLADVTDRIELRRRAIMELCAAISRALGGTQTEGVQGASRLG